jgi:hypothetical protein
MNKQFISMYVIFVFVDVEMACAGRHQNELLRYLIMIRGFAYKYTHFYQVISL